MSKFGTGNNGHYRGTMSAAEQIRMANEAEHERYNALAWRLVDLIGKPAFDAWIDENWPEAGVPWSEACKLIEAELDRFECSCTPDRDIPCAGCQAYFAAKSAISCPEYDMVEVRTW